MSLYPSLASYKFFLQVCSQYLSAGQISAGKLIPFAASAGFEGLEFLPLEEDMHTPQCLY